MQNAPKKHLKKGQSYIIVTQTQGGSFMPPQQQGIIPHLSHLIQGLSMFMRFCLMVGLLRTPPSVLAGVYSVVLWGAVAVAIPAQSATLLMYGDITRDETNKKYLTEQQFITHLSVFDATPDIPFVSLDTMMQNLDNPHQVGISFSGAYRGAYDVAMVPLLKRQIPFTVFVHTNRVGRAEYLSWPQLQDLANQGVILAVNPASQNTLPRLSKTAVQGILQKTKTAFFDAMGYYPKYISHPYGIASDRVMGTMQSMGFVAAFGQYSGAFNQNTNPYNLPRFSMSRRYGSESRLQQAIRTQAMPITNFLPDDPYLPPQKNPPALGFTFDAPVKNKAGLSCFHSQLGPVKDIQWLGQRRAEVRFAKPFRRGSSRINCTMPVPGGKHWYWLGQQFYITG